MENTCRSFFIIRVSTCFKKKNRSSWGSYVRVKLQFSFSCLTIQKHNRRGPVTSAVCEGKVQKRQENKTKPKWTKKFCRFYVCSRVFFSYWREKSDCSKIAGRQGWQKTGKESRRLGRRSNSLEYLAFST